MSVVMAEIGLHNQRVFLDFLGPALGDFPTVVEHRNVIGNLHHQIHVVFDEEDFAYALSTYNVIPQDFYDAFYFTAGTVLEDPVGRKLPPFDKQVNVMQNETALAELMLRCGVRFNDKVRLGCQQHVLLWPDKEKGV